jgi:hypothetical protein
MKDLKKSDFGALCDSYRSKRQMSIADMAEALERQGYKLGKGRKADTASKPTNHQPLITHYEHRIGDTELDRKKHLDPPLKYVEACAKLFNLNTVEKYELFAAAINSSSTIKIDQVISKGAIRNVMTSIIAALCLGRDLIPQVESIAAENAEYNIKQNEKKLLKSWSAFQERNTYFIEAIKKFDIEVEQNISGEKTI